MKQPMKSRDVLPKNFPGMGWVEGGHKSTIQQEFCLCDALMHRFY